MIRILILLFLALSIPTSAKQPEVPFKVRVSIGDVKGYKIETLLGSNSGTTTVLETLWEEGGIYVFPSSATTMTLSSDDANDTSAGTGARTIRIMGLDANFDDISEIVTLNGLTGVPTVNLYLRIQGNGLTVMSVGSNGSNVGITYIGTGIITSGKPANVFGLIASGINRSHVGVFTVPNDKVAKIDQLILSVEKGKFITLQIFEAPLGLPFINFATFQIFESAFNTRFLLSTVRTEKTDIDFRAKTDAVDGQGSVFVQALIIDRIQ